MDGGSLCRLIDWIARVGANEIFEPFDYVSLLESLEEFGQH